MVYDVLTFYRLAGNRVLRLLFSDDVGALIAGLLDLPQCLLCILVFFKIAHKAHPPWGVEVDIDGLVGQGVLHLLSRQFGLVAVLPRVAARIDGDAEALASPGCLATEYLPGLRAHLSAYGSADEHHALVVASLARRFLDRDLRLFGSWRTVAGQLHPRGVAALLGAAGL